MAEYDADISLTVIGVNAEDTKQIIEKCEKQLNVKSTEDLYSFYNAERLYITNTKTEIDMYSTINFGMAISDFLLHIKSIQAYELEVIHAQLRADGLIKRKYTYNKERKILTIETITDGYSFAADEDTCFCPNCFSRDITTIKTDREKKETCALCGALIEDWPDELFADEKIDDIHDTTTAHYKHTIITKTI